MQSIFATEVSEYMTRPALAVGPAEHLKDVYAQMLDWNISSLAVVENDALVGVVSRTDLLRVGRRQSSVPSKQNADARRVLLDFDPIPVADIMTREVSVATPTTRVADAAKMMSTEHVHRVFVTDGTKLHGVFSTLDVITAIRDSSAKEPIAEFMTSPIEVVDIEATVVSAVDQLAKAHVSGLIAVENDWPVGVFAQVEALAARELDDTAIIEDAMDPALICMPVDTTMRRAAQQALRMRIRRIVAVENRHMRGILSGLDFARFAARQA